MLDEKSFELIFKTYFSNLTIFARKFVYDLDTAKEIVHNVFFNLWEKRNEVDTGRSLKTYLFSSVYNRSLNYLRDNKKFIQGDISEVYTRVVNEEVTSGIEQAELEQRISEALKKLPEKCREIFTLNRFDDLKYKEIAGKLNISIKTVEAQMSKALRIMRDELNEYLPAILFLMWIIKKG